MRQLTPRSGGPFGSLAGLAICVLLAVSACGSAHVGKAAVGPPSPQPANGPFPEPHPQIPPVPAGACQQTPNSFSCGMQHRISEVKRYIANQPGEIGVELHDRDTGASWGNKDADTDFPAASTIKLAIIT